jgi:hypothetical protein
MPFSSWLWGNIGRVNFGENVKKWKRFRGKFGKIWKMKKDEER